MSHQLASYWVNLLSIAAWYPSVHLLIIEISACDENRKQESYEENRGGQRKIRACRTLGVARGRGQ